MMCRLSIAALVLMLTGCVGRVIKPAADVQIANPERIDWSDWAATLAQAASSDGVDYGRLIQDPVPLRRTLARVALTGPDRRPDQFPDDRSRVCYVINCYNAAILDTIIRLMDRTSVSSSAVEFEFRYVIDGRPMSPADLRHEAITFSHDDWRVRFALCDAHRVGPALFRHPFLPDLLDGQLNDVVREALASDHVVAVSHSERKLLLWDELYSIRGRLVADYERRHKADGASMLNVLLEWADENRRFTLNSAVGYDVAVLPDDHQLNYLIPPIPESQQGVFARLAAFSLLKSAK